MAESEEIWIRKRAYTLWEEEGYPSGKDREHWERAKLEYATLGPTASKKSAAGSGGKSATAVKPPKAGSKSATPKPAAKTAAAKASPAKTTSKAPAAAMPEAVQPAKKRSKKVPAGA
ncbi:Hypothetical protein NGAL_HAMBI1145_23040 [Neorhizobium galegae bv. officinalis]|jgi:hypothetical protein|uniref:DUF2934 domain-containing protein n=1 Tax=Neorhizobium galegae bv. officinalis TaxID=323656 RepID=A0A0T7FH60_NEOGA|nr:MULTISPECIES: DUF2934 domain-containing protein [Neorhizobium]CDZ34331.1 Hypothetical protein NGAL_HAMBI1145_23040 [Neorhizobium galegae bv. officinalis]